MFFIYYQHVFDTFYRLNLLGVIETFGITRKLVNLTKFLKNSEATIMIGRSMRRIFKSTSYVRQRDALSALLFNLALHKVT